MKQIYIVLTHTGTTLSKIIRSCTKDEFSHSSISLDRELKEMYSFGRLNPYNPFWGGFVHEGIDCGTFKRFQATWANVYALTVEDEQYQQIQSIIHYIEATKALHNFNVIGLFAVGIHKRIHSDHAFYCAEFVKYVLEQAGIGTNLPELIRPESFKQLANIKLVYQGKLKDYKVEKGKVLERIMNGRRREVIV